MLRAPICMLLRWFEKLLQWVARGHRKQPICSD
jgi:hypothetical protein